MTSKNETSGNKVELDSALSDILTDAATRMGLCFEAVVSPENHKKTFYAKKADNAQLVGVIEFDPFTTRATSAFTSSADDNSVSVISVSMKLEQPEEGQEPLLDADQLQTLFKLSSHALSALTTKLYQESMKIQHGIWEFTPGA